MEGNVDIIGYIDNIIYSWLLFTWWCVVPRPHRGESKSEYISRAVRYMVKVEHLTQDHALGKAYGMWRQHKKKKGKG